MDKKVSIIVPIYGVEKYLERCINSIINQTYHNIEIILVDDGSPDNCGHICDKYARKDNRIKVIHKKNGGLSDARNYGLREAKGDIVAFVDSDDWIDEDTIKSTVRAMLKYKADIVLFGFYKTDGKMCESIYNTNNIESYNTEEALELLCENNKVQSHAWDKIYRRELWDGIEFPVGKLYEDVFIMHKVFQKAEQVIKIDTPYYYYFQRNNSIITIKSNKAFYDFVEGCIKREEDLKTYNSRIVQYTKANTIKAIIDVLRNICRDTDERFNFEYVEFVNKLKKYKNCYKACKKLSFSMKVDFFIIKISGRFYKSYRKILEKIKKNKSYVAILKKKLHWLKQKVYKSKNKIHFKKYQYLSDEVKGNRIILMGGPEYNNLGDHAIAYATQKFISQNFPDIKYIEITENDINANLKLIKKYIKPTDILLLQGGGNFGDIYMDQQHIRSRVIKTFPTNKIILMPQTCYFSDTKKGNKCLRDTKELLRKHTNVILFAREEYSYQKIKTYFTENETYLCPDIVLSLENQEATQSREGVNLCIRDDKEGMLDIAAKKWITNVCNKYFTIIDESDTCILEAVIKENRESILRKYWENLSKHELMITDRLHGMIFSVITKTPCIVLDNNNYKIRGVYRWLSDCSWIAYCDNPYEIENYICRIKNIETNSININKEFDLLRYIIRGEAR